MSVYEGVYKSLIQGVSQQTPQEREDGQLGAQLNMLSDPVTGLRRRAGMKHIHSIASVDPASYIRIINIDGVQRIIAIDTTEGALHVFNAFGESEATWSTLKSTYLKTLNGKSSIKTTTARGNFFIVNTEQVPTLVERPVNTVLDSTKYGYLTVLRASYSKTYSVTVTLGEYTQTFSVVSGFIANPSTTTSIAAQFRTELNADTEFSARFTTAVLANTVAIEVIDKSTEDSLNVVSVTGASFMGTSGTSRVPTISDLPNSVPTNLDTYTVAIGNTGDSVYYQYSSSTQLWSDVDPVLVTLPLSTRLDPAKYGYLSVRSSQFSKAFNITVTYGTYSDSFTVTASASSASSASPEWVAQQFMAKFAETEFASRFVTAILGTTVSIEAIDKDNDSVLDVQTTSGDTYMLVSGSSRVTAKSNLLGTLPAALDTYTVAVGNTGNSAYYQYDNKEHTWAEVGQYRIPYVVIDTPKYLYFDAGGTPVLTELEIPERPAGDDDNNPLPKFIGYGITGISAYQSRLVLLSGAYVNLSRTTDFSQFMRTSVSEVLDDDAIEISSAALSSVQFEYAVPYNKDLVLIAQDQQAVIPANSTVLTPKTAVIYPSTKLDISLATEPVTVARSMYYTYQRGVEYYQVGEFIPNSYTDSQYYSQNLTDHIPLYATGICTTLASSTTNNMVVLCSDSKEVLVNQFLWRGEERPLMAFHKWSLPYKVVYAQFLQEYLVLFMSDDAGNLVIGTMNVQLNQLDDKPVPYLDSYQYVTITDGEGVAPEVLPTGDIVATIYDTVLSRHKEVMVTIENGIVKCPYNGTVVLGTRYESSFQLTPPFIKDDSGKVVAGTRTTIQQLRMTFKGTGAFDVLVQDTMGIAYDNDDDTALTWSETDLGYSWVNSIGSVVIPCRTRLSSTQCSVSTTGTTDLNLVSTEYVLRTTSKRRRL